MLYIISSLIILSFIIYALYENYELSVSKYTVINKKIPSGFNNYKIAHISDTHTIKCMYTIKKIVNKINNSNVDIVVITGDLYDERRKNRKGVNYLIDNISKDIRIYYALGNHEKRCKFLNEALEELIKRNVIILRDENILLEKDSDKINLLGIEDAYFISKDRTKFYEITKEKIERVKYDKKLYSIMLIHRPELFNLYIEEKIDLVLSGHAHGGQFILPIIKSVYAPEQGLFPKLTMGVHSKEKTTLVISRGLGNSGFPIRINNRPELVMITLSNKEE